MIIPPFTLAGYSDLVTGLLDRGYVATSFAAADPAKQHLILRHDVDFSPRVALEMAKTEATLNVSSVYFVLIRSELYNPLTPRHLADLHAIADLGHEVGLHFDASLYGASSDELDAAAARECELLETALGQDVMTISFHRPATSLLGYEHRLAGRRHAYEPRFFSDIGYCSDSRGAWRYGAPLANAAVREKRALQLLTHPIWWFGKPSFPEDKLRRFLDDLSTQLDSELATQCDVHVPDTAEKAK